MKAQISNSNQSNINKTNFSCKLRTEGVADWIVWRKREATTGRQNQKDKKTKRQKDKKTKRQKDKKT